MAAPASTAARAPCRVASATNRLVLALLTIADLRRFTRPPTELGMQAFGLQAECQHFQVSTRRASSRPGRGIRATKSGTEASPPFVGRGRLGSEPSPGTSHTWQSEPTNPRTLDRGLGGVMRRAGIQVQAMAKLADLSAWVRECDLLNVCIEHDGIPEVMAMPRGRSLPWDGIR